MDYPLSDEQVKCIETFLQTTSEPFFYTRIEKKYQEVFKFLVEQRYVLDESSFGFSAGAYKNHFRKAYCIDEIIRQINEKNRLILARIRKDEQERLKNKRISIATLTVSILSLIVSFYGVFI